MESVLDKQTGVSYTGLGNILHNEIKPIGQYYFGPVTATSRWTDATIESVINGPLRSSFALTGRLGAHTVRITGHVYPETSRIAFESQIDSSGGAGQFLTEVGLPGAGSVHADVHFGVEERDVHKIAYEGGERLRKNVFWGSHWADFSDTRGGVTLLATTGEKGFLHSPENNTLAHYLLMVNPPVQTWERLITPAREGTGRHEFDYQFLLHSGDWRSGQVVRRALEARFPLLPYFQAELKPPVERRLPEEKSFLKFQGGAVLSAFYRDGKRFLLRLYEPAGVQASVSVLLPFVPANVREVDLIGGDRARKIGLSGSTLALDLRPWEIVTLAIQM